MYRLRRALGPDAFVMGATSIALNTQVVECDVAEFAAAIESGDMRRAAALHTGDFLDGFHLSDSVDFERWVDRERAVLHGQLTSALESLARAAAESGDLAAVVRYRTRLAAADPLSSRLALEMMDALEAVGDCPGALRVADTHASLVREELDAPPDPTILACVDRLRRMPERTAASGSLGEFRSLAAAEPSDLHPGPSRRSGAAADRPDHSETRDGPPRRLGEGQGPRDAHDHGWLRRSAPWLALAGLFVLLGIATRMGTGVRSGAVERARVEVRSFENETGDASLAPIGRMAADWITQGLVGTGLVQVVEGAIGGPADARVSGSVYRTGDSIRIRANIARPGDGLVLHALDAVTAPRTSPVGALEPLRQRVLGALGTLYDERLTALAPAVLRPPTYAAYREFAEGIDSFSSRQWDAAAHSFRRAAAIDSGYLQPRLWLAWSLVWNGDFARADSVIRALDAVRGEMSPLERAWHDRLAAGNAGNHEASFRAAERMVEIAPRSGWVVALADAALDTNRPGVAISTLLHAGMDNLGPEQRYAWNLLTIAYHVSGRYEDELETVERAVTAVGFGWARFGEGIPALAAMGRVDALERRLAELRHVPSPGGPTPLEVAIVELRSHGFVEQAGALLDRLDDSAWALPDDGADGQPASGTVRADLLYEMGRWREARQAFERAPDAHDAIQSRAMRGLLAARLNDTTTARVVANELAAVDEPFMFGKPTFLRARIEAALGHNQEAMILLRQSFAEGQWQHAWYAVRHFVDFEPLRTDPSFRRFIEPRS